MPTYVTVDEEENIHLKGNNTEVDSSVLAEQALVQIDKLAKTLAKLLASARPDEAIIAKKEQLADISKIVKQWEAKKLPLSDEFRVIQLSLSSELDCLHDKIANVERVRDRLTQLLESFPKKGMDLLSTKKERKLRRPREVHNPKTKGAVFRELIIEILREFGGKARASRVMAEIERRLGDSFTQGDLEFESDGKTLAWWKTAQWERNRLVLKKVIRSDSSKGMWELVKK